MPPKEDRTNDATSPFDEPVDRPLPQDGDTPFSPPPEEDDEVGRIPKDHPAFDSATDIDSQEAYDEGLEGAAGLDDQEEGR